MAARPELIFCADGNPRAAALAIGLGYRYGARLPRTVYHPPYFVDQDWKNPDRVSYMKALAEWSPRMATVLDWEREEQWEEVQDWAWEAGRLVKSIVVIPKIPGTVPLLDPAWVVGYSVPTRFGATSVPLWELKGRRVHLLGGSPQAQMRAWSILSNCAEVVSADGNMALKLANTRCCYWTAKTTEHGHWQPINRAVAEDAPLECLRRSLVNIRESWERRK